MKKIKFVAIILVVAIMVIGVGYAYWQEELKINSTVTTGDLNVIFEEGENLAGEYDNVLWSNDYLDVGLERLDAGKKLSFTITNIYPGSGGLLSFKIINEGTVPAAITEITRANLSESVPGLKDEFNYTIHSLMLYRNLFDIVEIIVPVSAPIYADTLDEFVSRLSNVMDDYTLEPGDWWELNWLDENSGERCGYDIEMPAATSDDIFEDGVLKFDLLLNFQQGE